MKKLFLLLATNLVYLAIVAQEVTVRRSNIIEIVQGQPFYIHLIIEGQTLETIAQAYNVTVQDIFQANAWLQAPVLKGQIIKIPTKSQAQVAKPVQQLATPAESMPDAYVVKPKETLFSLARRFGITMEEIERLNPGVKDGLRAGQTLVLRSPSGLQQHSQPKYDTITGFRFHRVARAETLHTIAKRYDLTERDILKFNPHASQPLQRRQVLKIPVYHIFEAKTDASDKTPHVAPGAVKAAQIPVKNNQQKPDDIFRTEQKFRIALLIPFFLEEADTTLFVSSTSVADPEKFRPFTFMQFYLGAKLAVDSLTKLGMQASVSVFDVGATLADAKRVIQNPELRKMDLIIGPLFAQNFDLVAHFANTNKIPIINPLSTRSNFLNNNPFSVKIQPTNRQLAEVISTVINQIQGRPNVITIRHFSFSEQDLLNSLRGSLTNIPVLDVIYSQDSLDLFVKNLNPSEENIIVILSRERVFCVDLLRKLHDHRSTYNMRVIGLEGWEEFNIESDQKVNLRLTLPVISHIDFNSEPVLRFVNSFRSKYMIEPNAAQYAFKGYDVVFYSMLSLFKTGGGEKFLQHLADFPYRGLSMNFDFDPPAEGVGLENNGLIVYETNYYFTTEIYP